MPVSRKSPEKESRYRAFARSYSGRSRTPWTAAFADSIASGPSGSHITRCGDPNAFMKRPATSPAWPRIGSVSIRSDPGASAFTFFNGPIRRESASSQETGAYVPEPRAPESFIGRDSRSGW